jgi:hypothetical protein
MIAPTTRDHAAQFLLKEICECGDHALYFVFTSQRRCIDELSDDRASLVGRNGRVAGLTMFFLFYELIRVRNCRGRVR